MANMGAGIFGGVTTATATMRTVANILFGGKTQACFNCSWCNLACNSIGA